MKLTLRRVGQVFASVRTPDDKVHAIDRMDCRLSNGAVVEAFGRFEFVPAIVMVVFEDRTFRVGAAGCPMTKESLAACSRAYTFIQRLQLEET